jgi:hypothetical protein
LGLSPIINSQTKGITFLAQIGTFDLEGPSIGRWSKGGSLGLQGELKDEWDNYLKGLEGSGFKLNAKNDTLICSWNTKEGKINVE